jgi:hypothetical protein
MPSHVFYDEIYGLPIGLTIGTEAYTDRVDLRSAVESRATKELAKRWSGATMVVPTLTLTPGQPTRAPFNATAVNAAMSAA